MAGVKTVKVYSHQLQSGMYVSGLDRPWLETPFPSHGFLLRDMVDAQRVSMFCDYVFVDVSKSIIKIDITVEKPPEPQVRRKLDASPDAFKKELATRRLVNYSDTTEITEEIKSASVAYDAVRAEYDQLVNRVEKGAALHVAKLHETLEPLVDSLIRNPSAGIWLSRLKTRESYLYRHNIAVGIWCVVIGRQIGLPKRELQLLATGGMLLDIGKLKIPRQFLDKEASLTDREFELLKKHVDVSVRLTRESSRRVPAPINDMIASHHERYNGGGYPEGLTGTEIPLYARIAAIADCYDAITSDRMHAEPVPHSTAIKQINDWRGDDFQPELVDAFIKCTGIYPAGTLVELTSGEVAIVIKENPGKRLRPQVLVIMSRDKRELDVFQQLDLADPEIRAQRNLDIKQTLKAGAYGLDPEALYI